MHIFHVEKHLLLIILMCGEAQDGGVWDRRVCVGSSKSLDLKKVESGKYPQERDRRKEQFKR